MQDTSEPAAPRPRFLRLQVGSRDPAELPSFFRGPINVYQQRFITKLCLNRYFEGTEAGDLIFEYYQGVLAGDVCHRVVVVARFGLAKHDNLEIHQIAFDEIWGYIVKFARIDDSETVKECLITLTGAASMNHSWARQLVCILVNLLEEHVLPRTLPRKLILALYGALGALLADFQTSSGSRDLTLDEPPTAVLVNDTIDRLLDFGLGNDILGLFLDDTPVDEDLNPTVLAYRLAHSFAMRPEGRHFAEWGQPFIEPIGRRIMQLRMEAAERQRRVREGIEVWARVNIERQQERARG